MKNPIIEIMTNPVIDSDGNKFWYNTERKRHREDGPAVEWADEVKWWYINGLRHRVDGPAIEYPNGTKVWYINGERMTKEVNQWIKDNNFPDYEQWDDSIKVLFKLTFG